MNEIRRFAGPELMGPVTTLHWGEATVEGSRALRDLGYKGQLGYFNVDDHLPPVSYYLTVEQRRALAMAIEICYRSARPQESAENAGKNLT